MNDYMEIKFPEAYKAARQICAEMEKNLKLSLYDVVIGYLAMHLERVMVTELQEKNA